MAPVVYIKISEGIVTNVLRQVAAALIIYLVCALVVVDTSNIIGKNAKYIAFAIVTFIQSMILY
jgi:hypothetical protein